MRSVATEPYEQLAELIESELALVVECRFDELARVNAVRAALVATLPAVAPASARHALERCATLNRQVRDELLQRRSATVAALAEIRRGRHALGGYIPFSRRRSRISASA